MCGICGFTQTNNLGKPKEILSTMLSVIRHRGPDDTGTFIDETVALGVSRLSIIDVAGGAQPIHNEDKTLWLVYNGEIYNFTELRESLEKKGHVFYTRTDSEVIIHLFEEHRYDCVEKLSGMFAFCVYDRTKNELFLARDRFGMKPLYYSVYNGRLLFASEIKSLLQFPGFKRELDPKALDLYLTLEYVPAPYSIFKHIRKLPAASFAVYKNGSLSIVPYWKLDISKAGAGIKEGEAVERLRHILARTVKKHLTSDVPLGIFLSGGIDSSTITAFARQSAGGRLKTFSIGFKERSFDETKYAHRIAQLYRTDHHHHAFEQKDLLDLLDEAAGFLDEPLGDASFFSTFLLSKFARQEVTVALSGDAGDELFAGYPTYQAHKLIRFYNLVPRAIRERVITGIVRRLLVSHDNFSFDYKAKKFIASAAYPEALRHLYWMGSFSPEEKMALCSPNLRAMLPQDPLPEFAGSLLSGLQSADWLTRMQCLDMQAYLQDDILVKTDRASMANSLEVRIPYLDHELVEFVLGLPACLRLNRLTTKYILKKAAQGLVPVAVANKEKKGFGLPVALWLGGPLKDIVTSAFEKNKIRGEGLFDHAYIERLLQEHFDRRHDNRKKIWTLFMFEQWLKNYLS